MLRYLKSKIFEKHYMKYILYTIIIFYLGYVLIFIWSVKNYMFNNETLNK